MANQVVEPVPIVAPGRAGDGLALAATLIWAVNVVVVKVAIHTSGPLTYATLRYLIGGICLWVVATRVEGRPRMPRGREWRLVLAAAGTGVALSQVTFTGALALKSADFVAMFFGTLPLMVAVWVAWRTKDRFTPRVWAGLVIGLLGVMLVAYSGLRGANAWSGLLLAVASPLASAVYLLLLPPLLRIYKPLSLAALMALVGSAMMLPLGAAEAAVRHPSISLGWLGLLVFSALGAVLATNALWMVAVRHLGAARAAVFNYLEPFISVVAAAVLIHEAIVPVQLLGGLLIFISLAVGRPQAVQVTPA